MLSCLAFLAFHIQLIFRRQQLKISAICTLFQPMKSQIFCILKINWCIPFSPHFLLESRCVNRTLSRRPQIQFCDNYDNYMKQTNERFLRVILRVICLLRLFRKCFIFIWGSHFIVGISFVTYGDFMYNIQSILNFESDQQL